MERSNSKQKQGGAWPRQGQKPSVPGFVWD
jgi:hypothetical protein